jgi:hypothetical protein
VRSFPNIDKSGFKVGEYVGYALGTVWRIRKEGKVWSAAIKGPFRNVGCVFLRAKRLADISDMLSKLVVVE